MILPILSSTNFDIHKKKSIYEKSVSCFCLNYCKKGAEML